jgi:hypothetical protein
MKPKTKVVFARLTMDKYRKLAEMAKNQTRTVSNMITVILDEFIEGAPLAQAGTSKD